MCYYTMLLSFLSVLLLPVLPSALPNPSPLPALDLTHPFKQGLTIQWPTANRFNFTVIHRDYVAGPGSFYYESNDFEQSEHAGTHLDAPAHFAKGKWRTEEVVGRDANTNLN